MRFPWISNPVKDERTIQLRDFPGATYLFSQAIHSCPWMMNATKVCLLWTFSVLISHSSPHTRPFKLYWTFRGQHFTKSLFILYFSWDVFISFLCLSSRNLLLFHLDKNCLLRFTIRIPYHLKQMQFMKMQFLNWSFIWRFEQIVWILKLTHCFSLFFLIYKFSFYIY